MSRMRLPPPHFVLNLHEAEVDLTQGKMLDLV